MESEKHLRYWELPVDQLRQYIVDNWEDESLDVGDALHNYYEKARPRDWLAVEEETRNFWKDLFLEEIPESCAIHGVIVSACAASAAGVWDTVAEAFGLDARYVELTLAKWYERKMFKGKEEAAEPPITWEEFMRRYEAEKAEWEGDKECKRYNPCEADESGYCARCHSEAYP